MDGRLWLWPSAGSVGSEIQSAHAAPVSKVACLTPAGVAASGGSSSSGRSSVGVRSARAAAAAAAGPVLAVSCSYDKTVKVWGVSSSRGKQLAVLQGHAGPVLEMAVHPAGGCIVTGRFRFAGQAMVLVACCMQCSGM
jgi:WD40 repeat protein